MNWKYGNLSKHSIDVTPSSFKTLVYEALSRANQHYRFEKNRRQRVKLGPHLLKDLGFDGNGNPLNDAFHP